MPGTRQILETIKDVAAMVVANRLHDAHLPRAIELFSDQRMMKLPGALEFGQG
jgi:hypothetical protein